MQGGFAAGYCALLIGETTIRVGTKEELTILAFLGSRFASVRGGKRADEH